MISAIFTIRFNFQVDASRLNIPLEADVQKHHSNTFYEVTNFRVPGHGNREVLPAISIRKDKEQWVHIDSGKSSDLSDAVGEAIAVAEASQTEGDD